MALTPLSAQEIRAVLDDARTGRASIVQLAQAYESATTRGLSGCSNELRTHMLDKLSPVPHRAGRDVALGVLSGFLTHALLKTV